MMGYDNFATTKSKAHNASLSDVRTEEAVNTKRDTRIDGKSLSLSCISFHSKTKSDAPIMETSLL
jgi:hypothetical protein